jgi:hypothetical protein
LLTCLHLAEMHGALACAGRGTMANHLASIFGTEKDRVNCPFYFKIGWASAAATPAATG